MSSRNNTKMVDWFHIASLTEESVLVCLDKTIDSLRLRHEFLDAVRTNLAGELVKNHEKDRLRFLIEQVRIFEKTLEFRLSWLKPDRAASWTRPLVGNRFGPFGVQLFTEPVIGSYDVRRLAQVRERIKKAWALASKDPDLLFDDATPTLWHKLIQLKILLFKVRVFSFAGIKFDLENLDYENLDKIGLKVDSANFYLFFKSLAKELHAISRKMEETYTKLWSACETLWDLQLKSQSFDQTKIASTLKSDYRSTAEKVRSELRDRRQAGRIIPGFMSATEIQALKFMGFDTLPDEELLKSRYREMARKLHPDLNQGKEEGFKLLTQSYHVLNRSLVSCLR